jgi:hypothetical protein
MVGARVGHHPPVEMGAIAQPPAATPQDQGEPGERRRAETGVVVGDEEDERVLDRFLGVGRTRRVPEQVCVALLVDLAGQPAHLIGLVFLVHRGPPSVVG